eukprot:SAG22_NODE_4476_length_1257_cov_1.255613_1_plen_124_part_00
MVFERGYTNYPYCCPSRSASSARSAVALLTVSLEAQTDRPVSARASAADSFMSGRLPDRSQVWTFTNSFRDNASVTFEPERREKWISMPQHFKDSGWWAAGAGKLYHPGSPPDADNPLSWSIK